jgi:hypothetical protein
VYNSRHLHGNVTIEKKTALLRMAIELSKSPVKPIGQQMDTVDWVTGLFSSEHVWDEKMFYYDVGFLCIT